MKAVILAAALFAVAFSANAQTVPPISDAIQSGVDRAGPPVAKPQHDAGAPAQLAEVHMDITRGNPVSIRRGLFGERLPVITSASGTDYWLPDSQQAKAASAWTRALIFGASASVPRCADGRAPAMLYHFPGGHDCAADRPQ